MNSNKPDNDPLREFLGNIVKNMDAQQVRFLYNSWNLVIDLLNTANPNLYISNSDTQNLFREFLHTKMALLQAIYEQNKIHYIE